MEEFNIVYVILMFIGLGLSAFFSSSETAFIALQQVRIKHLEVSGVAAAERVGKVIKYPERFLSAILLGNNFVNTAVAALGTILAVSFWGRDTGVFIATIGVTILLLIFGEVTPKTIAVHHAERLAMWYIRPVELISWLFSPLITALSWVASQFLRLIGENHNPKTLVTEGEIQTAISIGEEEGVVEESEAEMLHRVFEFGDRQVHEVMTPRPNVVFLENGVNLPQFFTIFSQSPYSRFPMYEENTDNIIGVISIKDVLMAQAQGEIEPESHLNKLIRPAYFVPETKHVGELFAEMQSHGYQLAIVVDEYGGTAGVVTLEQLLEVIVGEIGDELAKVTREFEAIDERTYQIDGGMRVDEVNEELKLGIPPGEYETIAGFVLSTLGHIPKEGEKLQYDNLRLVVTEMKGRKISKILVERKET